MRLGRASLLTALGAWTASVVAGLWVHAIRAEHLSEGAEWTLQIENVGDAVRVAIWQTRVALADFAWLEAGKVIHKGLTSPEELHVEPTRLRPWPPRHVHDMDSVVEMMPWISLTTSLNPHHVRSYAVGAYYLSWQLDRPEAALEYLREGIENNPDDGVLRLTAGKIHLIHRRDAMAALPQLRRAVEGQFEEGLRGEENLLESVRFLAHALRLTGRWEEGFALWEEFARRFPEDQAYATGLRIYADLVADEETRTRFDHPDLAVPDPQSLEDALCPFEHPEGGESDPTHGPSDHTHGPHGHDHEHPGDHTG